MIAAVEIAEAVKAAIAGATWDRKFILTRTWLPKFELKDMDNLHIAVSPVSEREELVSRGDFSEDIRVDVCMMKKLPGKWGNVDVDPLVEFARIVARFFRRLRLASDKYLCVGLLHEPIVAREHLEELGQFTSLIQLSFNVIGD